MITADQQRLVFEPLGQGAWRLCDAGIDEASAERLIAYVERAASGGYVAEMFRMFVWLCVRGECVVYLCVCVRVE